MGEFQRWREEQRRAESAARGLHPPQPAKASIESDVWVPILQAFFVALVLSLAGAGTAWLLGATFVIGLKWGAGVGIAALTGCTTLFIWQHRRTITEPLDMMWERLTLALGASEPRPEPEPRFIVRNPRPAIPAVIEVEHAIPSIEPDVDPAIKALYEFITRTWPGGNVSRARCRELGFTRKTWEKYVGGGRRKTGSESHDRGLLDRAGCVHKTSSGSWAICASLDQALAINDDLHDYAERKAQMVRLGTGRTGRDGTHTGARPGRPRDGG